MSETQDLPTPLPRTTVPLAPVSIIIPAFNEENAIREEVNAVHSVMRNTGRDYEIIVVDDGSRDRTAERAAEVSCRLLKQPRNLGYGAALKRGIAAANHELVLITDADGTYPPEFIPRLLNEAPSYDMVVGSRTGADVHVPWQRRPAKWFLRMLASYLAGRIIPDLNSGLRLMRRGDVRHFARILPNGFSFTTTITLALLCNDRSVGYVPINYKKRIGSSKIRAAHAYHFLILILRAVVLFNPLKVFLPLGAVLFCGGAAKFLYDITRANLSESAVMGILAAILVWALGLLADQNSRLGMNHDTWPNDERHS